MTRKTTPQWIKDMVASGDLPPQKEFKEIKQKRKKSRSRR